MTDLQRFATAAPDALLIDRRFWLANRSFAAIAAGGALLIAALSWLTYPRSSEPAAWLSVLIHALVVVGLAAAARGLARTEVDDAIARLVQARASSELGKIKGRLKDRIFLDQLESDLLPHNPSHDQGAIKVFQYLINEAREHKFHDSFLAVEPLAGDGLSDLFCIQTLQKIAVQLGILGTFGGLIVALSRLASKRGELLSQESLGELLGALHISFSTSIAGLEVAIILGATAIVLRRRHETFLKDVESAAAAVISLARQSINRDDFLVELEQVRSVVSQLADRVREQSREMEVQTEVIRGGLGRLSELKLELNSFLEQVHGEQALVLAEMKTVYEIVSPKRAAQDLAEALEEANRRLVGSWREELAQAFAGLDKLDAGLRLLEKVGGRMWDELKGQTQEAAAARTAWREAVADLSGVVEGLTRLRTEPAAAFAVREAAPLARSQAGAQAALAQLESLAQARLETSLGKVAHQLENLGRHLVQNTATLREVATAGARRRARRFALSSWLRHLPAFLARLQGELAAIGAALSRQWRERRANK